MDTMTEKDATRYQHYDQYSSLATKPNNGTNTLKRDDSTGLLKSTSSSVGGIGPGTVIGTATTNSRKTRKKCCSCMGPDSAPFWAGLLTNLGICTLLFAYTLLGSFIFLAIEGGASTMHQRTLASTTNRQISNTRPLPTTSSKSQHRSIDNVTISPSAMSDAIEARQRTVENIWDITVSLNILYRENWTRLAALEIARFQDQLIKRFTEDFSSQLEGNAPSTGAVMILSHRGDSIHDYDWTFARAFLYSLTVLTTIDRR